MPDHTLVTEPYTPLPGGGVEDRTWLRLSCKGEECVWSALFIVSGRNTPEEVFQRDHGVLNEGRAPSIEVEWELVTTCPMCDRTLTQEDGETVSCDPCSATWSITGGYGSIDKDS